MPRRLVAHINRHPTRMAITLLAITAGAWATAGVAVKHSVDAAHQGRVENCIAVNELYRKIYITLADFDIPPAQRAKYIPTQKCEKLP